MNLIFLSLTLLSVGKYATGTNISAVALSKEFELYLRYTYVQLGTYYADLKENSKFLDTSLETNKFMMDESTVTIYETLLNNKIVKKFKEAIREEIGQGRKLAKCYHMLIKKITDRAAELSEQFFGELQAWLEAKSVLDILFERPRIEIETAIDRGEEAANYYRCDSPDISKCRVRGYQVSDAQLLNQMIDVYEKNFNLKRSKAYKNFNEHMYDDLESLVFEPVQNCIDENWNM